MAHTGQALSRLAAIVSLSSFRNGSVFDDGRVSSIYAPLPRTLTLLFVRNHFWECVPQRAVCLFVSKLPNLEEDGECKCESGWGSYIVVVRA